MSTKLLASIACIHMALSFLMRGLSSDESAWPFDGYGWVWFVGIPGFFCAAYNIWRLRE